MKPAPADAVSGLLPPGAWRVVALLWIVGLVNYLDRVLIASMHDAIVASIPMTDAQFGLLTSIFLWVYAGISPFAGYVADRFSRKWVIIFSLAAWSVCTWLTGEARTLGMLLAARGGMGISEACYIPASFALITDYHCGRTRSLASGIEVSGIYAGLALGGIGGFIAEFLGWRSGFTLLGGFGVAYAIILGVFLSNAPAAAAEEVRIARQGLWSAVAELFRCRGFTTFMTLNILVGVSNWLILAWLPLFLEQHFSLAVGLAGISATIYIQASSFVGAIAGARWSDRWAMTNPRARTVVPAVGYAVAAPALFYVAYTHWFAAAVGAMILFGLGKGFYDSNLMPALRQIACERHSATGYGILNCTSSLAGGIMTYVGGAFRDRQVPLSTFFEAAAIGLVVVAALLVQVRTNRAAEPAGCR